MRRPNFGRIAVASLLCGTLVAGAALADVPSWIGRLNKGVLNAINQLLYGSGVSINATGSQLGFSVAPQPGVTYGLATHQPVEASFVIGENLYSATVGPWTYRYTGDGVAAEDPTASMSYGASPKGVSVQYEYDTTLGQRTRITEVVAPEGADVQFEYDLHGQRTRNSGASVAVDADGVDLQFQYDLRGQRTKNGGGSVAVNADGANVQFRSVLPFGYGLRGLRTKNMGIAVNAEGVDLQFQYDSMGSPQTATCSLHFQYDPTTGQITGLGLRSTGAVAP